MYRVTQLQNALAQGLQFLKRRRLFILVVLGGLLVGLLAVGYLAAERSLAFALAAAFAPLGFMIAIQFIDRIDIWTIAILATAAFVRFTLPTGTSSVIVASMAVAGAAVALWLLRMLIVEKEFYLKSSPTNLPLLGFIVATIISMVWGIAFRDPLVTTWGSFLFVQLASLIVMILLPGVYLLVGNAIEEIGRLKVMVGLMLLAGAIGLIGDLRPLPYRINVWGIFPMWAAAIPYAWALFDRKLDLVPRLLLLAFAAGWIWYGYPRRITWLAAWVPTFAALGVITVMRSKWLIIVVVVVLAVVGWQYIETRYQGEVSESGRTRLEAWVQNWEVTSKHWLFGTGPAGYAAYYMSYFPTSAMATHSNYIDIISQTGVVGLGFCLWFLGALLWSGFRLCRRLAGQGGFAEGLANAALGGAVGCVVAMAIGDWMFPFAYTQTIAGFDYVVYNWIWIGVIPALDWMTSPDLDQIRPEVTL
jgi:hypothetical protein